MLLPYKMARKEKGDKVAKNGVARERMAQNMATSVPHSKAASAKAKAEAEAVTSCRANIIATMQRHACEMQFTKSEQKGKNRI